MSVDGILLLDKPAGPTSHDAVAAVRRAAGTRRVGHFGTLDPFATGLLVCGLGAATRLAPFATGHDKAYRARVRLGARSSTDDPEGVIETLAVPTPPALTDVIAACRPWMGVVAQVPPAYSAKHVDGRRAYQRVRAGETVVLEAAAVTIRRIDVVSYRWPDLELEIECGAGTYVRALARDLGEGLGTAGYCAALRRTQSGPFDVGAALPWAELAEPDRVRAALQPAERAVVELPAARLDAAGQTAVGHGHAVPAPSGWPRADGWARLVGPGGFIGLGELREVEGAAWLQPRKVLFVEGEAARRMGGPSR